jgi:hypothetical protein
MIGATVFVERVLRESAGWIWRGRAGLDAGNFEGDAFVSPRIAAGLRLGSDVRAGELDLGLAAGFTAGSPPTQEHALAGGRNTIPGYAYRSFAGGAFVIADAVASRDVRVPWVRARLLAAAGWVGDIGTTSRAAGVATDGPGRVRDLWNADRTGGIRTSVGAGVGLGWDVLRLDLVRGISRGGEWQLLLSVQPRLWSVL